ncbi:MAG: single-stranded DNA-binding protein [Anaerolineae bacterium]|nr:single-stranded DNA-binding protein [Chloroflexota bacterium]MCO6444321.1 single-stranded DNA-binding protein [Anaerolineae bacterium]
MARGLNKVMIIGSVGREPELRYTPNGAPVVNFDVAVVSHTWQTLDGERKEKTEWLNIVAWGRLAEICKTHLSRGNQVYIEGRLQTRSWEDETGKKLFRTEIVARDMKLLGERRQDADYDFDDLDDDSGI